MTNYALVALTLGGGVSRFMVSRGRWQDTGLRLPNVFPNVELLGDSALFLQDPKGSSIGVRLTLGNDDQIKAHYLPDLSEAPVKFKQVLAVSPSGRKVVVDGPDLMVLEYMRGRWFVLTGPINFFSAGARENAQVAFDLSERWLIVVSWFQMVNTIINSVYIYDVTRPTNHFVYQPIEDDFHGIRGFYSIAATHDGWFLESGEDASVYRTRIHPGGRGTVSFYAKGDLVGPVIGSDVAIYRDARTDQGRIVLGWKTIGILPDTTANSFWQPIFWPGVGVVWRQESELRQTRLWLNKQPIPLADQNRETRYFLVSRL